MSKFDDSYTLSKVDDSYTLCSSNNNNTNSSSNSTTVAATRAYTHNTHTHRNFRLNSIEQDSFAAAVSQPLQECVARKQLRKFSGRERQTETETTTKRAREGKGAGAREVQIFAFVIRGAIMVSCWGCNPSEGVSPCRIEKKQNMLLF